MVSQQHLNTIMTVIMPLGQNLPSVTLGKREFTIFSELLVQHQTPILQLPMKKKNQRKKTKRKN